MSEDADAEAHADAELTVRLRSRDAQAFVKLFELYFEALVRFAYYMIRSRDTAKDLVQDVFVRVWERPEALDPNRSIKQYMYTAVRNRVLDERKRQSVRSRHQESELTMAESDPSLLETPSPEGEVISAATVEAAMERLPERRREAVRLRIQEQLTHAEIGQILGISAVAAERLVFRALEDLREILRVSG